MDAAFNLVTEIFDLLLLPFRNIAPVWGIAFIALLTAVFILWVYTWASNQGEIKRLKRLMQGHFLGMYLFRDAPAQILRSLGNVLTCSLRYMGYSFVPLAVVLVPVALVCVQMQLRYGHRSPEVGERLRVSIGMVRGARSATIQTSPGLRADSPPVRIGGDEIDWGVIALARGEQKLAFTVDGSMVEQPIPVGETAVRIYPVRSRASILNSLLYPGGEPLDGAGPVSFIRIDYAPARVSLAGFELHWSIAYFLLAILFGLFMKRFFRVEF